MIHSLFYWFGLVNTLNGLYTVLNSGDVRCSVNALDFLCGLAVCSVSPVGEKINCMY